MVATAAWFLLCSFAVGFGIALLTGFVSDETAGASNSPVGGLSFIGAAIFAMLAYYLSVVRRLAKEQRT